MHPYNLLARHILAPGYDLLRGTHTMRCLAELERSQWWPPERIAALQSERLGRLIEHAYRTVPHYRSVMQQRGITPADIRSSTDLRALPIISRSYVQQHGEDMRSEAYPQHLLRRTRTSGSTGTPLEFYGTVEDQVNRGFARGIRALEYTGLHLGDRTRSRPVKWCMRASSPSTAAQCMPAGSATSCSMASTLVLSDAWGR